MKFCTNCGKQIKDEAKFCPFCGAPQPEIAPDGVVVAQPGNSEVTPAVEPVEAAVGIQLVEEVSEAFENAAPQVEPTQPVVEEPIEAVAEEPVEEVVQVPAEEFSAEELSVESGDTVPEVNVEEVVPDEPQEPVQSAPIQSAPVQQAPVTPVRPAAEYVQPQQAAPEQFQGAANPAPQQQAPQQNTQQAPQQQAQQSSPQMDAVMANGKNYFSFLNQNVKHPDMQVTANNYNGLINAVLIAIFSVAAGTHAFSGVLSYALTNRSSSGPSPFPGFLIAFFWVICSIAVQMLVAFVFSNSVVHKPLTMLGVLNKIFAPASIAVYVAAVALLFSFLSQTPQIVTLLVIGVGLIVNLAFAGAIWDLSGGLKPTSRFYSVMATFVCNTVIGYIVGMIFMAMLSSKINLETILNNIFGEFF